jgi:uncharacterized membrane protein YtjA (UPF0391 family)
MIQRNAPICPKTPEQSPRASNGLTRADWPSERIDKMLWYAWVFLVVALLAAILGFGGIAVAAASIAKICFVLFLVLFLISAIAGRRRTI